MSAADRRARHRQRRGPVAYTNREALAATLRSGEAVFWSTSQSELHHKGSTSGDILEVVEIRVNCEQNSLLYSVRLRGEAACHVRDMTGVANRSCFVRTLAEACI